MNEGFLKEGGDKRKDTKSIAVLIRRARVEQHHQRKNDIILSEKKITHHKIIKIKN